MERGSCVRLCIRGRLAGGIPRRRKTLHTREVVRQSRARPRSGPKKKCSGGGGGERNARTRVHATSPWASNAHGGASGSGSGRRGSAQDGVEVAAKDVVRHQTKQKWPEHGGRREEHSVLHIGGVAGLYKHRSFDPHVPPPQRSCGKSRRPTLPRSLSSFHRAILPPSRRIEIE